ncbi:hypothetical protein E6P09_14065 [Haloferax mediterranei ATCC 33500]|uniref:Uncharacterized protein n=1 Tax=Haloferax mediterranei (strain ATCC 33500 / DSM 1411 / JCM 8866 / NBRC 14739 / NCIMB 2177 / R-4) TaxID=523841 RepID=I3R7L2_HALMT|nr:DUF5694 domain-containing protein [Haloferax mediterranei]AFK20222.1 hypothetical protein HFX_2541 [Haloferax mediterranei ATCC 33500]AHZ23594.1 hypothetical protein BM92_13515 [Haloferax mediterranei ATCC 33500]ELZ99078.1 hypothetical protein C439_14504 [Haloferax mediterranei ATCC 33500]MDX5987025.1 DUF5694 domain-containing protein [Haloferax mediterranei ATCC 33500]QCQ76341.1 hypothetical protein E6P09_14065 [Haloferax mediterranei ATCC 33500]
MLRPRATARKTPAWPTPTPEQVEVVLFGTYHMDDPGLDEVNVSADDVLTDGRQRELDSLVSNLERIGPDFVAVERPASQAEAVNDLYVRYRDGEATYDEEHAFEPRHPERDDARMACRSEVIQIGFRLADRLGHDRVVPVDVPEQLGTGPDFEELEERGYEPTPKIDIPRIDHDELQQSLDDRLADSTITAYHRYLNEAAALHYNDGMFDEFLRYGDQDNYAGPDALSRWYRRNLRMIHNIWRAVDEDTNRVCFVVGSGHVHILRQLLTEFPQFCPVSPLPYLPRGE